MSAAQETPAQGIDTDVAALRPLDPDRAFERMYRRHASDVYRYALAVLRDAGDAEDVTQTTFLNAFRAFQRGERPVKAKSWLIAIAHNVCLQRFRTVSRRPQQVAFDEDLAEATVPEESPSADDLLRALNQLSFNQRSALVMRELEGRSYKEIGETLSLPVSAVETLLFRARRALREQLETSLTCNEAEELLSRQLDGRLARGERGALRAHVRACEECARLARSQRAQRSAWKALSFVPLPTSLSSLFGGGGGAVATGMAAKVAAVGAAAVLVGGGTYEGVRVVETQVAAPPAKPVAAAHARTTSRHRDARPEHSAVSPLTRDRGQAFGRHEEREHAPKSDGGRRGQTVDQTSRSHARATAQVAHDTAPGQLKKAAGTRSALAQPATGGPRSRAGAHPRRTKKQSHGQGRGRGHSSVKAGVKAAKGKGSAGAEAAGQSASVATRSSTSMADANHPSPSGSGKKR